MSVLRIKKSDNYVSIHKGALENPRLSFKAKGLWAYCMSRPDDWTFHVSHLSTVSKDGEDAIYSAIKELEKEGYITKVQEVKDGRFQKVDYMVLEVPLEFKKCLPHRDFPDAVFPDAENPALLSNDSNQVLKDTKHIAQPPAEPIKEPSHRKKVKEEFVVREERVMTTASQHENLLKHASGDEDLVRKWYSKLSSWKIGKGLTGGKRDYASILDWVIGAVKKDVEKNEDSAKNPNSEITGARKENLEKNLELINDLKIEYPNRFSGLRVFYKTNTLISKEPSFDISLLVDHRSLRRYLEQKFGIKLLEEGSSNG